jgi:site-specific DNA recombinase
MKRVRCAIYTRKSSEEGLEQDFNSLHAQREACSAYVLSQASEGWAALPEVYDDGGLSGGTLERPALKRLLEDIAAGRIDIVVVYKVDRLTRSLLDFSKLVEAFDKAGTSFVSVTQSFNTTTSMGRLTLNMLLSFAQFEREVTAERIRDKIAASKARGMWMGGTPPIGYRPDGRSLAIVEDDAAMIRDIFARYLEVGNVRLLASELGAARIHVPPRTTLTGRGFGGGGFTRGQLYKLLSNPTYIGEIHHKDHVYKGLHPAIVDRSMWDEVQQRLADNTRGEQARFRVKSPSLLAGLIVDEHGGPLVATHACKGKVRYRYYVSRALQHEPEDAEGAGMRIPAREIEAAVIERVGEALNDPLALLASAGVKLEPDEIRATMAHAQQVAGLIRKKDYTSIRCLVAQVKTTRSEIEIELSTAELAKALRLNITPDRSSLIPLIAKVRLTRTGRAVRLVHSSGKAATAGTTDPALVKLILQARRWWVRLASGEADITKIAETEQVNDSWVSRVIRLNFLAPQLIEEILAGSQPARLTATSLLGTTLPIEWDEQREAIFGH